VPFGADQVWSLSYLIFQCPTDQHLTSHIGAISDPWSLINASCSVIETDMVSSKLDPSADIGGILCDLENVLSARPFTRSESHRCVTHFNLAQFPILIVDNLGMT